ncbi:MAG TPA: CDC27 family protein [Pirellulales bacterium]|nr:CDC27 family protein [Pirellulales bacterium]
MAVALSVASTAFAKLDENQLNVFGLDPKFTGAAADDLEKAWKSLQEGNGDRAFELLEAAKAKSKSLPPARVLLARMLFATNQAQLTNLARQTLEKAAADSEDNKSPEVPLLFGNLAVAEGRLSDAELQYQKALSLAPGVFSPNPKDPALQRFTRQVYQGLTSVYELRQDWAKAKSSALLWLEAAGDDKKQEAQAEQRLGRAAFFSDDREAARDHFEKAYEFDSSIEYPLVSLGLLAAQQSDEDKKPTAEEYFKEAIDAAEGGKVKDNKAKAAIEAQVSQWMLLNGKTEDAAKHALAAVNADPESDAFKRLSGLVALYQGNYSEAERLFADMYNRNPADFFASNNLALALIEAKGTDEKAKHDRAVSIAEVNARANPRSVEAAATLGWIYYKMGRSAEAEQALRAAISVGQASSDTAYYLANVLIQQNRFDEAIKVLQQAIGVNGPFAHRKDAEDLLKRYRPDIDISKLKPEKTPAKPTASSSGSTGSDDKGEAKDDKEKKSSKAPPAK